MNEMATFIQAGFLGMMAREKMEEEENEIRRAIGYTVDNGGMLISQVILLSNPILLSNIS